MDVSRRPSPIRTRRRSLRQAFAGAALGGLIAAPASAQMLLSGVGAPPSAAAPTAPFLLAGGNEFNTTAGTHPTFTTTANCPAGSVITAGIATFNAGTNQTSFTDGTNTYVNSGTATVDYNGTGASAFQTWATGPIAATLAAGTALGPVSSISSKLYGLVFCVPGMTARDPEAGALSTGAGSPTATSVVPSNSTQPQYAAFFVLGSSQMNPAGFTAPGTYTDLGGTTALDSPSGDFGVRGFITQLTTTGSPTTLTGTFTSGGAGVTWGAGQRTAK